MKGDTRSLDYSSSDQTRPEGFDAMGMGLGV